MLQREIVGREDNYFDAQYCNSLRYFVFFIRRFYGSITSFDLQQMPTNTPGVVCKQLLDIFYPNTVQLFVIPSRCPNFLLSPIGRRSCSK